MAEYLKLIDVFREARVACKAAGSQRAFGETCGLSSSEISDILNARRPVNKRLLDGLKLEEVVLYRRKKT